MTHLVQLQSPTSRRLALVREPNLHLLPFDSLYDLLTLALKTNEPLSAIITRSVTHDTLPYDPLYNGQSDWKILPPLMHPDPAHTIVSGTGLTHLGSAKNRASMHENTVAAAPVATETDSMKMFRWGLESGKPAADKIGIPPEWFFKGSGHILRAHNQPLDVPSYAEDGGEEAEIAGIYLIDKNGTPLRVGMAQGNEYSDHVFEKKNYLNLAGSKLRQCAIGPEIVLNPVFTSVPGAASIHRNGTQIWTKPFSTGEDEMSHSLANIEHHHFKFEAHRIPGDIHIHFYGTAALSFGDGLKLQHNDIMQVSFQTFGRPLRNPLRTTSTPDPLIRAKPLS